LKRHLFSLKILTLFILPGLMSCSTMFSGERKDFRDRFNDAEEGATTGGRFTEGNWIRETEGNVPMGHLENPSSRIPSQKGKFNEGEKPGLTNGSAEPGVSLASADDFNQNPALAKRMKPGKRSTKDDFLDSSQGDGSLWTSDGQTNYYLTKNKVKTTGDLLTVTADDEFVKMVSLELKRNLTPDEKNFEMNYAENQAAAKLAVGKEAEAAAARAPASADETKKEDAEKKDALAWADIDLGKYIQFKSGDPVMAEVVDRYPNGNYKIRGVKKVRYRNSLRYMNFVGIAKHGDIADDDTISAGKLYEYRLEAMR
jgi:hypothetical protein